jgi:hypothetical protein
MAAPESLEDSEAMPKVPLSLLGPGANSMNTIEEWKPFPRFEDWYEISTLGRCRSIRLRHGCRGIGHILKPETTPNGYLRYNVHNEHGTVHVFAHVAVASAFLGPAPSKHNTAHLDGVRSHNSLSNLAWKTQADNLADKYLHGTDFRWERNPAAKLNRYAVALIRAAHEYHIGPCLIQKAFNISSSQLKRIVNNESWTA